MNAHADLFPHIPAIVKTLPDQIDQMKLFELIQIVPTPTRSALRSGNFAGYRISDPRIMGYLRNNSIFTFGQADRAKNVGDLPRNPRRDVAVQREVRARAGQVQRDQGAEEFLNSGQVETTLCLITDQQLPGLDGLGLQNKLAADGSHVPVIFITAFPDANVRERAMKAGATAFLAKPFEEADLVRALQIALVRQ